MSMSFVCSSAFGKYFLSNLVSSFLNSILIVSTPPDSESSTTPTPTSEINSSLIFSSISFVVLLMFVILTIYRGTTSSSYCTMETSTRTLLTFSLYVSNWTFSSAIQFSSFFYAVIITFVMLHRQWWRVHCFLLFELNRDLQVRRFWRCLYSFFSLKESKEAFLLRRFCTYRSRWRFNFLFTFFWYWFKFLRTISSCKCSFYRRKRIH